MNKAMQKLAPMAGMHIMSIAEPDPDIVQGFSSVTYDLADWSRFPEVVEYAEARGISIATAVEQLVNSGLSHQ